MIAEWDLTATNLGKISQRRYRVAVIPTAAIEAHNRHLPQGQDFRHTTYVAQETCRRAWQACQAVVCLPTVPYGVDCNLLDFPLTINVSQSTLDALLGDIVKSLRRHQIQKIVLINGHGGNDFTPFVREIQCSLDVFVFACNWWTVGSDVYSEILEQSDDHAGEMETSVALALYPQLVQMDSASSGAVRGSRFEAVEKGWVKTSRRFARLNDHCAAGNPAAASAQKGREYLELVCTRISRFLVDLAEAPVDEHFPQLP